MFKQHRFASMLVFASSLAMACMMNPAATLAQGVATGGSGQVINVKQLGMTRAVQLIHQRGGGIIYFPAGVYNVRGEFWSGNGEIGWVTRLSFRNLNNLTIQGDGDASVIRLVSNDGHEQVRPLTVANCNNVIIKNIKIDGQRHRYQGREEQMNNVFVRWVDRFTMFNVTSMFSRGDGCNVGGVSNAIIRNNVFDKNDRNGLTLGEGFHSNVVIKDNFFGRGNDTQHIDFEHGEAENIRILRNTMETMAPEAPDQFAMSISRCSGVVVRENDVRNPILIRRADNVLLQDNDNIGQLTIDRDCRQITVHRNTLDVVGSVRVSNPNLGAILVREVQGLFPTNVIIKNNTILASGVPKVFAIQDVKQVSVYNNVTVANNVTHGLHLHAQNTNVRVTKFNNRFNSVSRPLTVLQTGGNRVINN